MQCCNLFYVSAHFHSQPRTHHPVEIDSEVHVVIMEKGISVLVLSHTESIKSEQRQSVEKCCSSVAASYLGYAREDD